MIVLTHSTVCLINRIFQQLRGQLFIDFYIAEQSRYDHVTNVLNSDTASFLPICVAAYTIRYDKQAEWLIACIACKRSLDGKKAVLIGFMLSLDPRV